MAAWRWSVLVSGLVACSSSGPTSSPAPLPTPTDETETTVSDVPAPSLLSPPPPVPVGGQSGTDSSDAYNCDARGAPPLTAVPLDAAPGRIRCSPEAVLASIAGTHTFDNCEVFWASDHVKNAGLVLTLQIQPGASAHLLDAVWTHEDGEVSSCDALGVDISLASTTPALELSADQVLVDWLCSSPAISTRGRLTLPEGVLPTDTGVAGSHEVDVLLAFDGLTGRVTRLGFLAPEYTMECVPWWLPPPPNDANGG